jgi:GNAT superfamily N-acetyltransferase
MIGPGDPNASPRRERPGPWRGPSAIPFARAARRDRITRSSGPDRSAEGVGCRLLDEVRRGVEYQVRAARITDIDRLVALASGVLGDGDTPLAAADLLRQLVYLPQASVLVAEARRELAGAAVLALRPSARAGGFVGTVDLLVVDEDHDADRVTDLLIEEVLRSARNKGCTMVEATRPAEPVERARWERHGFVDAGPRLERPVASARAATQAR